jgi:hypothetical protein
MLFLFFARPNVLFEHTISSGPLAPVEMTLPALRPFAAVPGRLFRSNLVQMDLPRSERVLEGAVLYCKVSVFTEDARRGVARHAGQLEGRRRLAATHADREHIGRAVVPPEHCLDWHILVGRFYRQALGKRGGC